MTAKDKLSIIPETIVINKIYELRGFNVMLDSDLAALYGVDTKVLNQAVKRNIDRFPEDFMFQLMQSEWQNLKSQIVTSSWGGRRKLPFVFSEHGVLMLSSVLSSPVAAQINIQIVRIFTKLRKLLNEHGELKLEIDDVKKKLTNQSKNIDLIFSYIDELTEKKLEPRRRIGYMPDDL
jgi:hypothetical protein